ncbi:unnamed protein product, partial [Prorocentrum cordatum]
AVSLFSAARDASLSTTRRPAPQHELYTFWGAQRDVLCAAAARAQVAHFRLTFCYLRGRTGKHWCAGEVRGGFVAARCEPNSLQFHILMRLMSIVFTPREKISHELLRGGGVWLTHTTATNQAEKFFVPELLGGGGTSRPPSTRHAGRTLPGGVPGPSDSNWRTPCPKIRRGVGRGSRGFEHLRAGGGGLAAGRGASLGEAARAAIIDLVI